MQEFDLIVLGTGGAGYAPAVECRKAGWRVAVINDGPYSGTCAVRGCIPKKVLAGVADILDSERRLRDLGIFVQGSTASWAELMKFKRSFTDPMPPNTEKELAAAGIALFSGSPHFIGPMEIEVNGQKLTGKKIHIAVGAKPSKLSIDGAEHVITSDEFLELNELPERMLFIGGGYISFEFAHIVARFGVAATILHGDNQPLPAFDSDIVDVLIEASRAAGIVVETDAEVSSVVKSSGGLTVHTKDGRDFTADVAVHGAGRVPAIDELNLEATGVDFDAKAGITVNDHLQTTKADITAAGDAAASGPPLSPVASRQGQIAAANLLGGSQTIPSFLSTPSVIFSTPAVGSVGYLEQAARDKGIEFDTKITDLTKWFDSQRTGLKFAKSKVLVERGTDKVIGAHLIGNHAEDLINIFSLAIELGLTTAQLKAPILAFPTTSDDLRSML